MADGSPLQRFLELFGGAVADGSLVRLTLGDPAGREKGPEKILVRAVALKGGPHLSFVYRYADRDVTRNLPPAEGIALVGDVLGSGFRAGFLSTTACTAEISVREGRKVRFVVGRPAQTEPPDTAHDRTKPRLVDPQSPWLRALGVTDARGAVRFDMAAKFRQIHRFVELLDPLLRDALPPDRRDVRLVDMGCGKGYLTFAAYEHLRRSGRDAAQVTGVEARAELVDLCNRVAREQGYEGLAFHAGTIDAWSAGRADVVVALHACDTATDDALAKGAGAGAALIVVSPCCHKELRPQIRPPAVLAPALRHGIFLEREAEFVTDALRAALLEWAGYETRVFEFVSPEHTARNLMIAAVRRRARGDGSDARARAARELAAFYGIREQRLARRLGLDLAADDGAG